jgi:hypothetical protein
MPGEMPQMVTVRPNAGAVRHEDRCGVIRNSRQEGFVLIVAHSTTPSDIIVEFQEYPDGLAGFRHFVSYARCLAGGVFGTQMPRARTLLCKSGLGLRLQGRFHSALVGPVLSFD